MFQRLRPHGFLFFAFCCCFCCYMKMFLKAGQLRKIGQSEKHILILLLKYSSLVQSYLCIYQSRSPQYLESFILSSAFSFCSSEAYLLTFFSLKVNCNFIQNLIKKFISLSILNNYLFMNVNLFDNYISDSVDSFHLPLPQLLLF